ncbi:MAG: twin-arginine translocase TatA/TatE family subunit [Armatimonadetes bacterium]|nr:twin-arginine translocase TatA/TatE family subunit [Armatimonadota bacterium]MDE2206090.1 twin-arginine translocase TatA/TatE family subunit [Armatimonadota bacterium]
MLPLAFLTNPTEWFIIAAVVLLLFGGTKIPEMMRGLGQGMREFKHGMREEDDELKRDREARNAAAPAPPPPANATEAEIERRVQERLKQERDKQAPSA